MLYSPDRYVEALHLAAVRHAGQTVPGTELPYLVHLVSVAAETIAGVEADRALVGDPDLAVTCALLHDAIEDTAVGAEARAALHGELGARFGAAVADGVLALSKDDALPKDARMADSLRRIRAQPREVWMVKLADRITNLAPPPARWSTEKRIAYRDEAIVIADALGEASPALHARIRARIAGYAAFLAVVLALMACGGGRHDPPKAAPAPAPAPVAVAPAPAPPPPAPPAPPVVDAGAAPEVAMLSDRERVEVLDSTALGTIKLVERPGPTLATAPPGGDSGDFTAEEIDRVIRSHAGLVKACYQKELAKKSELGGKIVVRIKIGEDGTVASATIAHTTMKDSKVEDCVRRQMLALRFPAKGPATVTYPFIFSAG